MRWLNYSNTLIVIIAQYLLILTEDFIHALSLRNPVWGETREDKRFYIVSGLVIMLWLLCTMLILSRMISEDYLFLNQQIKGKKSEIKLWKISQALTNIIRGIMLGIDLLKLKRDRKVTAHYCTFWEQSQAILSLYLNKTVSTIAESTFR